MIVKVFIALTLSGVASWYGKESHGNKTANSETFSRFKYTTAHRSLPFGTCLKVINPTNNKYVYVRVNDRGPYIDTRELDLSEAAFRRIESNLDLTPIKYTIVNMRYCQ